MKNIIRKILSVNWLLSSILCFYYLPFRKAIKMPILVGYGVKIGSLGSRNSLIINGSFASLCFALKGGPFSLGGKSFWYLGTHSKLFIRGSARISKGSNLKLFDGAELIIGDNFSANANLILSCASKIEIGNDNLFGWNVTIMDNDGGHQVFKNGILKNESRPIKLSNHVWIAAESSVLKGTEISENSIIGFKSNVCGLKCSENNAIITGNPASVKSTGSVWIH